MDDEWRKHEAHTSTGVLVDLSRRIDGNSSNPLGDFVKELVVLSASVPPDAIIAFEIAGEDDDIEICVSYERERTPEEAANYKEQCKVADDKRLARNREEYERLKAIFEPPTDA